MIAVAYNDSNSRLFVYVHNMLHGTVGELSFSVSPPSISNFSFVLRNGLGDRIYNSSGALALLAFLRLRERVNHADDADSRAKLDKVWTQVMEIHPNALTLADDERKKFEEAPA